MFGRFVFHDVPLVNVFPLAVFVLAAVSALAGWGLHGTVFGRLVFAVGDNPRAAKLAGVKVEFVRLGVFVTSALSAVTAGVMLGGFGGVSVDVGLGLEFRRSPPAWSAASNSWAGAERWSARSPAR